VPDGSETGTVTAGSHPMTGRTSYPEDRQVPIRGVPVFVGSAAARSDSNEGGT
jgi:hypothetical protein